MAEAVAAVWQKKIPKAITRHAPGYAGHVKIKVLGSLYFIQVSRNKMWLQEEI